MNPTNNSSILAFWKAKELLEREEARRSHELKEKARVSSVRNALPPQKYLENQNAYTGRFEQKSVDLNFYRGSRKYERTFLDFEKEIHLTRIDKSDVEKRSSTSEVEVKEIILKNVEISNEDDEISEEEDEISNEDDENSEEENKISNEDDEILEEENEISNDNSSESRGEDGCLSNIVRSVKNSLRRWFCCI